MNVSVYNVSPQKCISQPDRVRRMVEQRLSQLACPGVRSGKDSCLRKYASLARN
jgi:hypothetical protein